jgi:hypothetical protein
MITKTKYMINKQDGNKVKEIEWMRKKYEKVESFKYLGAVMTNFKFPPCIIAFIRRLIHT